MKKEYDIKKRAKSLTNYLSVGDDLEPIILSELELAFLAGQMDEIQTRLAEAARVEGIKLTAFKAIDDAEAPIVSTNKDNLFKRA